VYNMNDVPLGFATTARSTDECRKLEPTAIAAFHVAGEQGLLRRVRATDVLVRVWIRRGRVSQGR
jgi:hypothetical protein